MQSREIVAWLVVLSCSEQFEGPALRTQGRTYPVLWYSFDSTAMQDTLTSLLRSPPLCALPTVPSSSSTALRVCASRPRPCCARPSPSVSAPFCSSTSSTVSSSSCRWTSRTPTRCSPVPSSPSTSSSPPTSMSCSETSPCT